MTTENDHNEPQSQKNNTLDQPVQSTLLPAEELASAGEISAEKEAADDDRAESEKADDGVHDDAELSQLGEAEREDFAQKLPWILEAMLFTMDKASTPAQLAQVLKPRHRHVDAPLVRQALQQLLQAYQDEARLVARGFELLESGGAWMFTTRADYADYVNSLHASKPQRLSRAALEALAVIAYRQPVTRPQIDDVRGVDSSSAVRHLIDKQLVRVLGKSEELGRPLLYGTTPQFLQLLGLKSLSHLPTLQEFQELDEEHQARVEQAHGAAPVQVGDLVDGAGQVVSDETENASAQALEALESALHEADQSRRESEQILRPLDEHSTSQPLRDSADDKSPQDLADRDAESPQTDKVTTADAEQGPDSRDAAGPGVNGDDD